MSLEDPKWTAYCLGELPEAEREACEQALQADPALAAELEAHRELLQLLDTSLAHPVPGTGHIAADCVARVAPKPRRPLHLWIPTALAASLALLFGLPAWQARQAPEGLYGDPELLFDGIPEEAYTDFMPFGAPMAEEGLPAAPAPPLAEPQITPMRRAAPPPEPAAGRELRRQRAEPAEVYAAPAADALPARSFLMEFAAEDSDVQAEEDEDDEEDDEEEDEDDEDEEDSPESAP